MKQFVVFTIIACMAITANAFSCEKYKRQQGVICKMSAWVCDGKDWEKQTMEIEYPNGRSSTSSRSRSPCQGNGGSNGGDTSGGGACDDKSAYASRCGGWANDGECKANAAWMKSNCCKSCSNTGTVTKKEVSCTDKQGKCGEYAGNGYCQQGHKYADWMQINCCKSCKGGGSNKGSGSNTGGGGNTGGGASNAILQSANMYRAKHRNTAPLQWDTTLAAKAQAYANVLKNMALRNNGYVSLVHDGENKVKPKMGENLWYADTWKTGDNEYWCGRADKDWYAEIKDYSYATARTRGGPVGHFTQMVWVDTTRVGYGVAVFNSPRNNGNKIAIVVAKYQKPGNFNWMGKRLRDYTKNVQRLK